MTTRMIACGLGLVLMASGVAAQEDAAARAFAGMKSVRVDLPPVENTALQAKALSVGDLATLLTKGSVTTGTMTAGPRPGEKFFAFTFAKVEKGELKGYGDLSTGSTSMRGVGPDYLEVAWAKTDQGWAWVTVCPGSRSSAPKVDPFFEHLTVYSRSHGTRLFDATLPEYRGLLVVGFGMSGGNGAKPLMLSPKQNFEENLKKIDYALLLLYREFEKKEDYFAYTEKFKKEKAALQAAK